MRVRHDLVGVARQSGTPSPRPSPKGRGRACAVVLAFSLAACGVQVRDKASEAKAQSHEKAIEQAEGRIECAPEGAAQFAYVCAIDRVQSQDGLYLTLRQPDGGFRRLLVTKDGRGVIAADGAEQVVVMPLTPDRIEVAIGGSRYRLPATVRGGGQ